MKPKTSRKVFFFLKFWHQHFLINFKVDLLILIPFKRHYKKDFRGRLSGLITNVILIHLMNLFSVIIISKVLYYVDSQIFISRKLYSTFLSVLCFFQRLVQNIYVYFLWRVNNLALFNSPRRYSVPQSNKEKILNVCHVKLLQLTQFCIAEKGRDSTCDWNPWTCPMFHIRK